MGKYIRIDDHLLEEAMRATGLTSERAVVEEGLRLLVRMKGQAAIRELRGKVRWKGDLARSRRGRTS